MSSRKPPLRGIAAIVILVLAATGVLYERIGERRDRGRYAQIGRSVNIGGRTLNIDCSGEGGPVVVFETFGHMAGYTWSAIQPEVANFTRACWYDRAGYPGEVAGVVMIDANDVDDPQVQMPESAKGAWAKHFGSIAPQIRGAACFTFPPRRTSAIGLTPEQQTELDFLSDNPTAARSDSVCTREESMRQVRAAGNLGDLPLTVLASARQTSAWEKHDIEHVQPRLAQLSSRGRLVALGPEVTASAIIGAVRETVGGLQR